MDKSNGEYNLEQLCANAKAKGIVVVTVAFDLDHESTLNRLAGCASAADPGDPNAGKHAFTASSSDQLKTAFRQIANILAQMVRLSH